MIRYAGLGLLKPVAAMDVLRRDLEHHPTRDSRPRGPAPTPRPQVPKETYTRLEAAVQQALNSVNEEEGDDATGLRASVHEFGEALRTSLGPDPGGLRVMLPDDRHTVSRDVHPKYFKDWSTSVPAARTGHADHQRDQAQERCADRRHAVRSAPLEPGQPVLAGDGGVRLRTAGPAAAPGPHRPRGAAHWNRHTVEGAAARGGRRPRDVHRRAERRLRRQRHQLQAHLWHRELTGQADEGRRRADARAAARRPRLAARG